MLCHGLVDHLCLCYLRNASGLPQQSPERSHGRRAGGGEVRHTWTALHSTNAPLTRGLLSTPLMPHCSPLHSTNAPLPSASSLKEGQQSSTSLGLVWGCMVFTTACWVCCGFYFQGFLLKTLCLFLMYFLTIQFLFCLCQVYRCCLKGPSKVSSKYSLNVE